MVGTINVSNAVDSMRPVLIAREQRRFACYGRVVVVGLRCARDESVARVIDTRVGIIKCVYYGYTHTVVLHARVYVTL